MNTFEDLRGQALESLGVTGHRRSGPHEGAFHAEALAVVGTD